MSFFDSTMLSRNMILWCDLYVVHSGGRAEFMRIENNSDEGGNYISEENIQLIKFSIESDSMQVYL